MPFEVNDSTPTNTQHQPSPLQEEWFRASFTDTRARTPSADAVRAESTATNTGVERVQAVAPARDALADGSDRQDRSQRPEGAQTQWTVAVNLAANGTFSNDTLGADAQWKRLQQLAEQTRGVPVDLVVQVTSGSSGKGARAPGEGANVQRYLVSAGEIRQLFQGPSRGMAGDVTDLLRTANAVSPSQHLALIQQSHGAGTEGVQGDSGSATLGDFAEAIRAGLQGSNHERLDLIDFNACSMGVTSVVDQMGRVANHMVASPEVELGSPDGAYDGQNIQHTLSKLLENPNVTPLEFARNMVLQAAQGHNDGFNPVRQERGTGTPTLSHYDLQHLPAFNNSLNRFGEELAAAVSENPTNIDAIDKAIEDSTVLPRDAIIMGGTHVETRDLTNFANNIINEIDAGKISDRDGSLREAARRMLAAQRELQPHYHGAQEGGYDRLGGLNAFLPDLELRDPALEASPNINPIHSILRQTEKDNTFASFENRSFVINNISDAVSGMERLLGDSHAQTIQGLRQDLEAISRATSDAQLRQALDAMHARATVLNNGQFGVDINGAVRREVRDRYFRDEAIASLPGWQAFMESLRTSRP